jgi:hypothetical protein
MRLLGNNWNQWLACLLAGIVIGRLSVGQTHKPTVEKESKTVAIAENINPIRFSREFDGIVLLVPGELLRNAESPLDFFTDILTGFTTSMLAAKKTGEDKLPSEKANAAIERFLMDQIDEIYKSGRWASVEPPKTTSRGEAEQRNAAIRYYRNTIDAARSTMPLGTK